MNTSYNVHFQVKYHAIEQELIQLFQTAAAAATQEGGDEEGENGDKKEEENKEDKEDKEDKEEKREDENKEDEEEEDKEDKEDENKEDEEEENKEPVGYSLDDIHDICDKLYRDELMSVFGMDEFDEQVLHAHLLQVKTIMMCNASFVAMLQSLDGGRNIQELLFYMLFSRSLFYRMHWCICQQLLQGTISSEELEQLRVEASACAEAVFTSTA